MEDSSSLASDQQQQWQSTDTDDPPPIHGLPDTRHLAARTSGLYSLWNTSAIARICAHLRYTTDGIHSLSALARTCRLFGNTALAVLWFAIPSLTPLLYTFPSDLCVITRTRKYRDPSYEITFVRDALPADFERFRVYSTLVVEVYDQSELDPLEGPTVDPEVWEQVEQHQHEYAFPMLRSVRYGANYLHDQADRYPVFLAFGPSLQDVRIIATKIDPSLFVREQYRTPEEIYSRAIQRLAFAPSLRTLHVSTAGFWGRNWRSMDYLSLSLEYAIFYAGFQSLTDISVPDIPMLPYALYRLASISSLNTVNICICSSDYHWDSIPHGARFPMCFALVEHLTIRSDSFDWCIGFLRTFPLQSLRTISIATDDIVLPPLLHTFADTLAASPSAQMGAIVYINLQLGCFSERPLAEAVPIYGGAELASFFPFSSLTQLYISGHCHVLLDNNALEAVSRAWPRLRYLGLEPARCSKDAQIAQGLHPQQPRGTLLGLLPIAERCHELRELSLELDLATAPSSAELRRALSRLAARHSPCPLHTLTIGWSPLGDPVSLASSLSAWFPCLSRIVTARGTEVISEEQWPVAGDPWDLFPPSLADMLLRAQWAHVAALVPRFAKVRAQEHKWRAAEVAARARAKAVALDVEDVGDGLSRLSL